MAGRNGSLRGQTIKLNAKFLDASGNLTDPDVSPIVDIFPAGKDPNSGTTVDGDAVVLNATQTSLGIPPGTNFIVRDSLGCYSYEFPIPATADFGVWFDRWDATVDGQAIQAVFMFAVVGGGSIGTSQLFENNRVQVCIDADILDADGNKLSDEFCWYFTTSYNPLYSSVRRLRLECGPLLSEIPDDTINLAIFEASLFADGITFPVSPGGESNTSYYEFARREYVTCLAGAKLLGSKSSQGKSKRLADLSVDLSGSTGDKLGKLEACLAKWDHVVKSQGTLGQGTSLKPKGVVKGLLDPDRPDIGRLWTKWSPFSNDDVPAANTKVRRSGSKRSKNTFLNPRWSKWGRWGKD